MNLVMRLAAVFVLLFSVNSFADEVSTLPSGDAPSNEQIAASFQSDSSQVLNVLSQLLSNENVDHQFAIQSALETAPELTDEIVQIARDANISNEVITTAALLAGVDPTQIAEATAAGITPTSFALTPPAAPTVGSNGGGNGVVSPN